MNALRVVIINKSDDRGGAAVVSRRLMHALQQQGVHADMLVAERLTDDPDVYLAASPGKIKRTFLAERLDIFVRNGFNRADLFKVDTGTAGLSLSRHPLVQQADIVLLGWVNQGMLSLAEIGRIAAQKPVVWVMHDLWCATGICHHPGLCQRFMSECGNCPLLHGLTRGRHDLSHATYKRKKHLYTRLYATPITFVAVSNWLRGRCMESSLLAEERVEVIHNPIQIPEYKYIERPDDGRLYMLMTAARLDDPIKGLDTLTESLKELQRTHPEFIKDVTLSLLGNLKDETRLDALRSIPTMKVEWHPAVRVSEIEPFYRRAHILVSPSSYETLPGTLVEAQLYGALPVAFDSGGQRDIITDPTLGVLATRGHFAEAILQAADMVRNTDHQALSLRMYGAVKQHFAAENIATQFINLFNTLLK
ncbi:MAG: glycosyltransferase [Muribaculaceae bacterium]|nr:glycosyltransferase [Muribaculaceae bacterium]